MVKKIGTNLLAHRSGQVPPGLLHIICLLIAGLYYLAAAINNAQAATYFVDATSGDDSTPGTSEAPWKTINKAFNIATYGDTVILRRGDYGDFNFSNFPVYTGSMTEPLPLDTEFIIFKADVGHVPIFSSIKLGDTRKNDYVPYVLDGLTIQTTGNTIGLWLLSVVGTRIQNCKISGDDPEFGWGIQAPYGGGISNDIIIDTCTIHNFYRGIQFTGSNLIIRNSDIYDIGEQHLRIESGTISGIKIIIENNHIHHNILPMPDPLFHPDGIAMTGLNNVIIRNNILNDLAVQGIFTHGCNPPCPTNNLLIENNLLYNVLGAEANIGGDNFTIRNNTIIGLGGYGKTGSQSFGINSGTGHRIYNNIFICDYFTTGGIFDYHDYNIYRAVAGSPGETEKNSYEYPNYLAGGNAAALADLFVDPNNYDFRLKEGCRAINFGDPYYVPDEPNDLDGNPRITGGRIDAGCYEYQDPNPDTTAPSVPQNLNATPVSESQINLSWDASTDPESGISYYKIYRDGASTHIDTSVSTSYSDTGLNAGTPHSYQVSAVNGQGLESNKSNTDSATTSEDTTTPTIQSVSASETSVTIVFSETMDTNSAENKDFYKIKSDSNDIPVIAASLGADLITVTLTTSPHVEGSYTLTVEAVRDISGNPIEPASINYEYSNGLVGYWKFDEASGNTAFDSSGSGHNGTLVNGPTWTTGKIGSALLFDGTNNYVDIGVQDIAHPWTASLWVKREDSSNSNAALLDSPSYSLKLEQYPNLNKVGVSTYGVADNIFNYEAPIGKWAHLVFVGTQTQVTLYVDGNLMETITASISCPMAQISSVSRATKGALDEVRTYNRDLNAAEVAELYDAGNSDPVTHTLGVWAVNGSVTKTPDKASYNHGEEVTLQPEPDTGYSFVKWSGDLTGSSNPATIVMDADKLVTVTFAITVNTYTLNITADEDEGSVTKTPDQARYDNGTTVTLQATAKAGYSFTGWSGDASGTSNPTTVVMDGNKSVTANFTINNYTLNTTADEDEGSVTKTPDQPSYNHGTTVTLLATANTGYSFANWSGDVSGTNNPTTVFMDGNKSVTANFTINTYKISASAGSNGQISPDGITQVNYGASQAYTITADSGYKIYDVIVDGSSVGAVTTYTFTSVTANRTIAASFAIDEIDVTAPTVTNPSPQADSIQAPLNTLITLDITDPGDGVEANSVIIKVNNDNVYSGNTNKYSSAYGECYRTGTKACYTFVYQANERFNFDQTITVTVNATDFAGNSMEEYSYSFQTKMRAFGKNRKVNKNKNVNVESAGINNDRPATCSDSEGNIWAAWHAGVTGSRDIYVGKLTTGEEYFGESRNLTGNSTDQCNPAMTVGSDDKLYVAWQDNRRGNWDIYVSTSSDGINFSTERRVTDSNDNQINPAIVVDSSNNAYIVWEDDRNGNQDIYVAVSNNGFATKTISQITLDNSNQVESAIAVDSDNTVFVVWKDTRNSKNDIYGASSNNGPWTNIPVVTTEHSQSNPAIATESVGSILHLVWVDNTPGNNDIYYAKTTSGLPASPLIGSSIIDDTTGADQLRPAIVVSGSTSNNLLVFVCWEDERNADYDIYFAELGSGSGTNVFVDDDGTNTGQANPAIGIDGAGYPYLVWTDNRNTNTDIYYAGSTSIESTALASGNISTSSTTTVETADGVSIVVPAGAYPCDIKITISEVKNPPTTSKEYLSLPYDFGPSGIEFDPPVTITIPYELSASSSSVSAYWYNLLTAEPSQQGITDVEIVVISSTPHLYFKTTHFTQFFVGGSSSSGGISVSAGGGGGGGCSMSANSQAGIIELLLPYIGLTVTMVVLKLKDRRKRKAFNITKN